MTAASLPPASMRSASPSLIHRYASPTAWAPAAHAVTMQVFGPVRPRFIATCPAAAFAMRPGTMNGDTRPGPRSRSTRCCTRSVSMPPIPDEMITPARSRSTSGLPASSQASRAPPTANCVKRSVRLASFASIQSAGSNPRISPASLTWRSDVSKRSIGEIPERPEVIASQKASTPIPTGVTGPNPVTTTRRRSVSAVTSGADPELRGHEVEGLPDRADALHLVLGDRDAELVLQHEHGLGHVQGVRVQVLGEASVGRDLRLVHGQLLGQDLADLRLHLLTFHPDSSSCSCAGTSTTSGGQAVSPPSTASTAPFTYEASSDNRKRTAAATSAAVPGRPRGVASIRACSARSVLAPVMSVSTNPGHIAFTVMPREPTSRASDRVRPMTPALEAAYAACPGFPRRATAEDRLRMRPHRVFSISRRAAREHRKAPRRFVCRVRSHSSAGYRRVRPSRLTPALLTRPATGPSVETISPNASATLASSVTSMLTVAPLPPADSTPARVSPAASSPER